MISFPRRLSHGSALYPVIILLASFLLSYLAGAEPVISDRSDSDILDWDQARPDQIHQRLHDGKVAGRLDREFIDKLHVQTALDDATADYDVKFYDVRLRINDTTEQLSGRVQFAVEALTAMTELQFDLHSNMIIDSIVSNGQQLSFTRPGNTVVVSLATAITNGEAVVFDVHYRGHPVEGGLQAFAFDIRNSIKVMTTLSEPYFAPTWWPCKERMVDKPDSMNIALEVDTAFYAASNGTLDSTVQSTANTHTFYYRVRYPMATYLFSLAISKYTVWSQEFLYDGGAKSMPITQVVYPDRYDYSLPTWGITPTVIGVLSDLFGPYPFLNEKYGHANFQWGGAMEHQTITSMTGTNFGFSEPVIVHEASHQWWGDMITCASWHDIWLNEGWASYAEALYFQQTGGWGSYHSYMAPMAYAGGGTIYVSDTGSVGRIFHGGLSYDKGAWVCHMLRGVLGDELFFAGVDAYYNSEFQYGAATTEDFKNVFEAATGVELDWYFEDWIHGLYRPHYQYAWTTQPAAVGGGFDFLMVVKQIQTTSPSVFRMPVPFFFDFESQADDTLVFICDERRKLIKTHFDSDVLSVTIDPSNWVLKYADAVASGVFITTSSSDLKEGRVAYAYSDTIVVIGGSGEFQFSLVGTQGLPPQLSIDNQGVISGIPSAVGTYDFTVRVYDPQELLEDIVSLRIIVSSCCGEFTGGYSGNTDCDPDGKMNLSDITRLIDRVYISHLPLCCEADGNTDGDTYAMINLSDITRLIDRVYLSKDPTAACR